MSEEIQNSFFLISHLGNVAGDSNGYPTEEAANEEKARKGKLGFVGIVSNEKFPPKPKEFKELVKDLISVDKSTKRAENTLRDYQIMYNDDVWTMKPLKESLPTVSFTYVEKNPVFRVDNIENEVDIIKSKLTELFSIQKPKPEPKKKEETESTTEPGNDSE